MALSPSERWNTFVEKMLEWTPIARVVSLLDSMSPRDRKLLVFMVSSIVVLLVLVGTFQARNYLRRMEQEIARKELQLARVQTITGKYRSLSSRIERFEQELNENPDFNLTASLEQKATEIDMADAISINSRDDTSNEGFVEETVAVKLRKRSLVDAVRYLHAIETAPQRLTVKSLRIKTGYGSKSDLTIDVEVSILTPQET